MKASVMLDVAFLGHESRVRRGAERVAQHLFEGLAASDFCDLSFVATSHLAGAWEFLESRGVDAGEKLRCTRGQLGRSRLARRLSQKVQRSMDDRSLGARAARFALARASHLLAPDAGGISTAWLQRAQIYHSPHTPFPRAVHEAPRLRKFLTCHDFIPLHHPEYFSPGTRHFMDGVMACLRPENYAFCVSEATRNDLLNCTSMPAERVFVTPLAADRDVFHPVTDPSVLAAVRRRYSLGGEPYFLGLSAHDPHKNFVHLIECFGALVESGDLRDCNLVIVGPNPGRNAAVHSAISRYPKAAKNILVPGFIPDEDLASVYSGATAFLFPSFEEGFGIPPLEAMQCGTPVIASNTTSMPEVVGDAGVLLSPTDKDAWRQNMLKVVGDEILRRDLSGQAMKRAQLFSWERFIGEILRGYRFSLNIH